MGGSYKQCIQCGKRALSIATRCPGCGRELTGPVVWEGSPALKLGRFLSPRVVTGVLVAAAVLTTVWFSRTSRLSEPQSSFVTADSTAAYPAMAYVDPAIAAVSRDEDAAELLVARTWTSVRKSRSKSADLEAVLLPGDTVLADSLRQGWYRVALDGEVLGYVHRSTLTSPGASSGTRTTP
jgi:hypothetical protein